MVETRNTSFMVEVEQAIAGVGLLLVPNANLGPFW